MSQSNYSSARQGIIEDEQTYVEDTELFNEFRDEVYESFVISGVLCGLFNIPDFWEPDKKEKYLAHTWVQAPKRWIDPLKEVQAMKIAVQSGQKTFQQAAAENGRDWKDTIDDMVAVLEYGRKKGLELGGVIYDKSPKDLDPEGEDEDTPDVAAVLPALVGATGGTEQPGDTGTELDPAEKGTEDGEGGQESADEGAQ
jgi:capsid protein